MASRWPMSLCLIILSLSFSLISLESIWLFYHCLFSGCPQGTAQLSPGRLTRLIPPTSWVQSSLTPWHQWVYRRLCFDVCVFAFFPFILYSWLFFIYVSWEQKVLHHGFIIKHHYVMVICLYLWFFSLTHHIRLQHGRAVIHTTARRKNGSYSFKFAHSRNQTQDCTGKRGLRVRVTSPWTIAFQCLHCIRKAFHWMFSWLLSGWPGLDICASSCIQHQWNWSDCSKLLKVVNNWKTQSIG